jgi:hypothetical protein
MLANSYAVVGINEIPSSDATSSASTGCALPVKTMRFFSVVRLMLLTLAPSVPSSGGQAWFGAPASVAQPPS